MSDAVASQWNISDNLKWKDSEVIPYNYESINGESGLDKILYYCNPTTEAFFEKQRLTDIVLKRYASIKQPAWPTLHNLTDLVNLDDTICDKVCSILRCKNILTYLRTNIPATKTVWLYTDFHSQNEMAFLKKAYLYFKDPEKEKITDFSELTDTWQNVTVDKHAVYFLNNTDIQIKLQDWINNPELLVDLGLVDTVNQKQFDLLDHWRKLHPPGLLYSMGIL